MSTYACPSCGGVANQLWGCPTCKQIQAVNKQTRALKGANGGSGGLFGNAATKELKKLNATSKEIAAANAALVKIQDQALEQGARQLQIEKIRELEKNRQNELKQAAFSVEQKIIEITNNPSKVAQYFYLKEVLNEIDLVGLTPEAPNEIIDKQYVRDVLTKLHNVVNQVKASIAEHEIRDVDSHEDYTIELSEVKELRASLNSQLAQLKKPSPPKNIYLEIVLQILYPRLVNNRLINTVLLVPYYLFILVCLTIPVTLIVPILIGGGSYFLVRGKRLRNYEAASNGYEQKLQELTDNITNADINIDRLDNFFVKFKSDYYISA